MHRAFPILAAITGALLLAAFALGLAAAFVAGSPGASRWHGAHLALGGLATAALASLHAGVILMLRSARTKIANGVRAAGLPAWLDAIAVRNTRRAVPFLLAGGLLLGVTAGTGLGLAVGWDCDAARLGHLAVAAAILGFMPGVLVVAFLSLVAQARLRHAVAEGEATRVASRPESS